MGVSCVFTGFILSCLSLLYIVHHFLAFITVAVVCVMDLVVWNERGLIGLTFP